MRLLIRKIITKFRKFKLFIIYLIGKMFFKLKIGDSVHFLQLLVLL